MELSKTNNKEPYIKAHVLEGKTWYKDYLLILTIVGLGIIFSVMNPKFIGIINVFSILRAASILGCLALGMTVLIVLSHFDLSAAAIANFVSVISILFLMNGITNLPLIWTVSILVGVGLSFINGLFIIYAKVPAFVSTLGMSTLLMGASRALTGEGSGSPTFPASFPPGFTVLGKYDLGHLLPVSVIMLIIVSIVIWVIVEQTPFGRKLYAVGGNPDAAQHVGIEVNKVSLSGFLIAGLLYGIAGIMTSSMYGYADAGLTSSYQFPAIMSFLLGVSFLTLGYPNVKGTLVAVFLLSILVNGFTMINLPFYLKDIIQGLILIVAVGLVGAIRKKKVVLKNFEDVKIETNA